MNKAKINNEIILLRKNVEQARIQTIKKLSRSIFKLRQKKGTDAQKSKNQRKADRIAAEILAVKKMKKDEITKYVLTNTLNLREILENQNSTALARIMARIGNHKIFSTKISEFQRKYPDYMEYLGPGRKKKAKLERKEKRKAKDGTNEENTISSTDIENKDLDKSSSKTKGSKKTQSLKKESDSDTEQSVSEDEEDSDNEITENNIKSNNESTEEKENKERTEDQENSISSSKKDKIVKKEVPEKIKNKKVSNNIAEKEKLKAVSSKRKAKKVESNEEPLKKAKTEKKKVKTSKIISKEAIVKKFTDVIKDESDVKLDENEENAPSTKKSSLKIEKEVNSFFLTGDGETNYLSVALPKKDSNDVDNDDFNDKFANKFNKRSFLDKQNDRFFDKVPKYGKNNSNYDSSNRNSDYNSNNRNSKWANDKRPAMFNERNNSNYNSNNRNSKWSNGKRPAMSNGNEKFRNNKSDFKNFKGEKQNNSKPFNKQSKHNADKSNETLHPSWEAKKKQQEILKSGFQGKKIVFGDD